MSTSASLLEPPPEISWPHVEELRALTHVQLCNHCQSLAREGRADPEIAALIEWDVIDVRRALSRGCA